MAKKYVTWCSCDQTITQKGHPNTNNYWNDYQSWTFQETPYTDWEIYVWILDSDVEIPTTNFNIIEKTETEINTLLNTWYNWGVTVSNYIFTDNRTFDI